jgi:NitT/TauT family transport system substrate-binding protein
VRAAGPAAAAAAAAVLAVLFVPRHSGAEPPSGPEKAVLRVAAAPAADSAGFFVALHQGLFAKQGLAVRFVPAVSSETVIDQRAMSSPASPQALDVTCGNYVSYIQAQQAWDSGQRPGRPGIVAADLDIIAEGSVMGPGAQAIYVMPGSAATTVAGLKGKTIAINAPGNILYLLAASVLADNGIPPGQVHFVTRYPLPQMPAALSAGKVDAAVLPEPFASIAEQAYGTVPLADLNQGATASFPVQGCVVTKQWARQFPRTLATFWRAFEAGQEIADTSRAAAEQTMQALPAPLGVTRQTAALMAFDSYPVFPGSPGSVDVVRLQRVASVMHQFLGFPQFSITKMLIGGS